MEKEFEHLNDLKTTIESLPDKPGVYQYFNAQNEIIYVGKAKNLKKRVSSYFNKIHDSKKTNVLVKQIASLQYIIVETEEDALLLENNLIKKHQPRYNVLLKDDKTYPSICIKNEPFPRIFKTRNIEKDGSLYFGPYSSVYTINTILDLIRHLYPIRTCKYPLIKENIRSKKFKVCLEYHLKNCKGPCEGFQTESDYKKNIDEICEIIKGNANSISAYLLSKMKQLADEFKFEEAHELKKKYEIIENYKAKSLVANTSMNETDVFAYDENENSAYINILRISKGCIIQGYTIEYKKKIEEEKEDLLLLAIVELRERLNSISKEIIVPFPLKMELKDLTVSIPERGDKKKLLELSMQNVMQYKLDKLKQAEKLNPEQRSTRIMKTMQKDLQLKELPMQIECFDNSNIQGTDAVAACVVFKKGKASKKDYRHFNIKTVEGANDFASMEEIIYRRYKRLLDEKEPLPQLIVIDGGKGQLGAALNSLRELDLIDKIAIIGIAKRLEEIFFPGDPIPLYLDKNSETLKVIQQLRDEAHRFGITFHRNKRSKNQIKSSLDEIKGIGEKTKEQLLLKFKSVKRISEASIEDLKTEIGNAKAEIIFNFFKK
jgi:excinuclease ABC subunit C